MSSLGGAKVSL